MTIHPRRRAAWLMIVMGDVACVVAEACMRLVVPGIIGNSVANARGWRSIKCRI
ncbi:hypothetical protein BIFADO_00041 [Bifidobacterium adolescentis L2-32]|uniref:Uncharacterized protein n=1 Tax=Bifidobacterium adolescentis L2-32 TaxID=411481 RepID=A7A2L3_BIFAD|nr:hypothetical protein BIFADO_00041 [Bifidobacterium adolescentis L2-32]